MSESFHERGGPPKKRRRTQADGEAYYAWQTLPNDAYVEKQLAAMVEWFRARKDVLDRVWLETHDHFGQPLEPFNMEAA